ncbi:MAG: hypothetical protein Fur0043_21430 [Anaerolineales bacterium]
MKHQTIRSLWTGIVASGILLACSFGASAPATKTATPNIAPTTAPSMAPVSPPAATATAIQHNDIPIGLPPERKNQAGDHDSSITADQKRAPNGDRFTFGRFERPFNANTMDVYFPYLDIQDTTFYEDETWIYAAITLKGTDDNGQLAGRYAFEIDSDLDGRGEWLVLVDHPASKEWSVAGVQVWFDANKDVGGSVSVGADNGGNGDGYETLLVQNGQGDDPDLAWARLSSDNAVTVELAVKRSLLGTDKSYMIGGWAGNQALDPAQFDFNDHMTHEQAGAALIELENFYPIKGLAELDNVCRVAIGFAPKGSEPGSCVTRQAKEAEGCTGTVICFNFGNQQVCICQ